MVLGIKALLLVQIFSFNSFEWWGQENNFKNSNIFYDKNNVKQDSNFTNVSFSLLHSCSVRESNGCIERSMHCSHYFLNIHIYFENKILRFEQEIIKKEIFKLIFLYNLQKTT